MPRRELGVSIAVGLAEYAIVCARVISERMADVGKGGCEIVFSSSCVATISSWLERRRAAKSVNGLSSVTSGAMKVVTIFIRCRSAAASGLRGFWSMFANKVKNPDRG